MTTTPNRARPRGRLGAAGIAAPAILHGRPRRRSSPTNAAPRCPTGIRWPFAGREAVAKIKEESGGRLDITFYTNSVLGQDTAMISQAIAGALEMYCLPIDLLAPKNAACGDLRGRLRLRRLRHGWDAMDGDLGDYYLRDCRRGDRLPLHRKGVDHGFREITMKSKPINTPDDLKGVKIRLPVAPLSDRAVPGISARRRRRSISARSTARCRPGWSTGRKTR